VIYFQLGGRLGNQLFQWAAAKSIQKTRSEICLIHDDYHQNAPSKIIESMSNGNILLHKKNSIGRILQTVDKIFPQQANLGNLIYTEKDPFGKLGIIDVKTKIVRGFFQNWENVWSEKDLLSTALQKQTKKICEDSINIRNLNLDLSDAYVVHIRQSDYENSKFGVLSAEYYRKLNLDKTKNIIVFTDQPCLPRKYLEVLKPQRIITPNELSGEETFALMSSSKRLILANSTFSWWAGFLTLQNHGAVLIPSPWLKSGRYQGNLEYPGMMPVVAEFN